MRIARIAPTTRIDPAGASISLTGGPDAVLLLQGWAGWTGRLRFLAERLNDAGFTVSVPRLPGHGTHTSDLAQTDADDWLRRAVDAYLELRSEHDHVYVGGVSMGGILAALVAGHFGAERLALLAPAFTNRNWLIRLAPLARFLVRRVPTRWNPDRERNPDDRRLGEIYSRWIETRSAAQLLSLQRRGRRALTTLRVPTLVVVSESDPTVSPDVAHVIERRVRHAEVRVHTVRNSNHQLAEDEDREEVANAVIGWFRSP